MRQKNSSRFRKGLLVVLSIIISIAAGIAYLFEARLHAVVMDTAENAARAKAATILNAVLFAKTEELSAPLVTFEKDEGGRITALKTESTAVNRLKASLSLAAGEALDTLEDCGIEVALGTLLGSELAAGKGPKVHLHVQPLGVVETDIQNSMTSAGINQSLHRLYITVRAELVVICAGMRRKTSIETEVCVAETVIVGNVPGYYANIGRME